MLCRSPKPSMPKPTASLFHTQTYIVHRRSLLVLPLCTHPSSPTRNLEVCIQLTAPAFPSRTLCPRLSKPLLLPCSFLFCAPLLRTWCFLARISFFFFFLFWLLTCHPSRCLFLLKSSYARYKSRGYRSTILSETAQPLAPTQRPVI